MKSLEPIFNEFYASHEESIKIYGYEFIERLNAIEGDALDQITNGVVKNNSIPGDAGHLVISCFSPYSIHIYPSCTPAFIAWGQEIENVFQIILQRNEDRLAERVLLFKNLGDKTRYEVLRCIAKGITSTKVIAEQLGVSSATVSYHLSNLTTCKLIVLLHKEGRYDYAINHDFIEQCFSSLRDDLQS